MAFTSESLDIFMNRLTFWVNSRKIFFHKNRVAEPIIKRNEYVCGRKGFRLDHTAFVQCVWVGIRSAQFDSAKTYRQRHWVQMSSSKNFV